MIAKNSNRPVTLSGTGHAVPGRLVLSADLDDMSGLTPGTVEKKTGLKQRYFASQSETAAQLAALACRKAMDAARLSWDDIDVLVDASATMDQGLPNNAALIHNELGLDRYSISTFDINCSCLSFIVALDHISWMLTAGIYRRVLIVSSDIASCALDWSDLGTSGIFGDGAAAAVIGLSENNTSCILSSKSQTVSEGVSYCGIQAGGSRFHPSKVKKNFNELAYFYMDGKAVFKLVSKYISEFVDDLLAMAGLSMDDIDRVVLHQASLSAMNHISKRLKIPDEKIINIFPYYGNQVAASLPTALDIGIKEGRIVCGQRVLLLGTGAGITISGLIMVY